MTYLTLIYHVIVIVIVIILHIPDWCGNCQTEDHHHRQGEKEEGGDGELFHFCVFPLVISGISVVDRDDGFLLV